MIGMAYRPAVFAIQKFFDFPLRNGFEMRAYIRVGQNASFKCSHTLSLTAAMSARGGHSPDHSNTK